MNSLEAHDRQMGLLARIHEERKVNVPEGQSGDWRVTKFEVPQYSIAAIRAAMQGRAVPPGTYTRLAKAGTGLFMSDTPAEYADAAPFISGAYGHVLISGLGLGMVIKALLRKSADLLSSITVLENDPDVIKLVAPTYEDPRVRIIEADAFTWAPDRTFDFAWHDIWPSICEDNLPEMAALCRHYARSMVAPGRQIVWSRDLLRREARRYA